MKPFYETIDVSANSSLKIATYNHSQNCNLDNWHIHPEYELVFIKNGRGTLRIDSKTLPYENGTLLFLGPNIPHADFGNKEHLDNLEVVVQFDKAFVEEKLSVFPEFKMIKKMIQKSPEVILFDTSIKNSLIKDFEKLEQMGHAKKLIQFILLLEELAGTEHYTTLLDKKTWIAHKASEVRRLETIFEYVNEHYSENISTQALASLLGLTTNSFCRFFKKMTHQPFIQFVNEFRIRKAMKLFNETTLSISEVMYQCGFNNPSYFTKQFKKYQLHTPSEYLALNSTLHS